MRHTKTFNLFRLGIILSVCWALVFNPSTVQAVPGAAFSVDSAGDLPDSIPGDGQCLTAGGECTLRAAIQESNALAGQDTVTILSLTLSISITAPLPPLTDTLGTVIQGFPSEVDGTNAGAGTDGIKLISDHNKIQRLEISHFSGSGIYIAGSDNILGIDGDGSGDDAEGNVIVDNGGDGVVIQGDHNTLAGNWIGTMDGVTSRPNHMGVVLLPGASGNVIGTNGDVISDDLEGNLISGNGNIGIFMQEGATQNRLAGNIIGANAAGSAALPNHDDGISLWGAPGNVIGTNGDGLADAMEGNLISGNAGEGIYIYGITSTLNVVSDNIIGTNAAGNAALTNLGAGIWLSGAPGNLIGTNGDGLSDDLEGNLISGNKLDGLYLDGITTTQNIIAGNFIGTDITGTQVLTNGWYGIEVFNAPANYIGTDGDGVSDMLERNLISGNGLDGIAIGGVSAYQNVVAGNYVGTDVNGGAAIPNGSRGILIDNATGNVIGTDGDGLGDEAERNLVSGNKLDGIYIHGLGASQNQVARNYIGTDILGLIAIPNGGVGVRISAASSNIVGTNGDGLGDALEGNLISGNILTGTLIEDLSSQQNEVAGNRIGANALGNAAMPNGGAGIEIKAAFGNRIGTNGDGLSDGLEGNLVSGNSGAGVVLSGEATNNRISGNRIGVLATEDTPLPNGKDGVRIENGMSNVIGLSLDGSSGAANTIAFNQGAGIYVGENLKNTLRGNIIYENQTLGIDLAPPGVNPNDAGDGDSGPNELQNFPVLGITDVLEGSLTFTGTLNSLPDAQFILDLYTNVTCDPSGYGQGQVYLTSLLVTTNSSGNTSFTLLVEGGLPQGNFVTATATDSQGNTSEFSACVEVQLPNTSFTFLPMIVK